MNALAESTAALRRATEQMSETSGVIAEAAARVVAMRGQISMLDTTLRYLREIARAHVAGVEFNDKFSSERVVDLCSEAIRQIEVNPL